MANSETSLRRKPTALWMAEQKMRRNQTLGKRVVPLNQPTLKSGLLPDFPIK